MYLYWFIFVVSADVKRYVDVAQVTKVNMLAVRLIEHNYDFKTQKLS